MKKVPTGFVAVCQCGEIVGALDYNRTDRQDAGKIIGGWLTDGCTVSPRFDSHWTEKISVCKCDEAEQSPNVLHENSYGVIPDEL